MSNLQKGILVLLAILAMGNIYFDTKKSSVSFAACKDFDSLSSFVLESIEEPQSLSEDVGTAPFDHAFQWKRESSEPFIVYPALKGIRADYLQFDPEIEAVPVHSADSLTATIEKASQALTPVISAEAMRLGMTADPINTMPLKSYDLFDGKGSFIEDFSYLQTFGFKKGDDLYSIVIRRVKEYPGVGNGEVTVSCGRAPENYDAFYDAIKPVKNTSIQDPFNDLFGIVQTSKDKVVYFVFSPDHSIDESYYHFDGKNIESLDTKVGPIECKILETRKIGLGMQCTEILSDDPTKPFNGISRFVTY